MKKFVAVLSFLVLICVGMSAYTLTIRAYELPSNIQLNAQIWRNGFYTGHNTPYTFSTAEFEPGDYSCQLTCYEQWLPAVVTFIAITANIGFSFYAITPCTVPVELSSFTAVLTTENNVNLNWVSQSEIIMLGYRVYRSETNDQAGSVLITPTMIPATNTSTTQTYNVTDDEVEIDHTYYYWLESVDMGSSQFYGPVSMIVQGEVPPVLPETSSIKSAYPNPFKSNGSTSIDVSVKEGENGTVTVYNIIGQAVRTFQVTEGNHTIVWNGKNANDETCGSGIYFYKLSTPSVNQTKKMVIVK
jgi:hypothetical protein